MNKTILNLHMKNGEEQLIECEWFTMTQPETLVVTRINKHGKYEKIIYENVEWFGGWNAKDAD